MSKRAPSAYEVPPAPLVPPPQVARAGKGVCDSLTHELHEITADVDFLILQRLLAVRTGGPTGGWVQPGSRSERGTRYSIARTTRSLTAAPVAVNGCLRPHRMEFAVLRSSGLLQKAGTEASRSLLRLQRSVDASWPPCKCHDT